MYGEDVVDDRAQATQLGLAEDPNGALPAAAELELDLGALAGVYPPVRSQAALLSS